MWENILEISDAINLIRDYKKIISRTILKKYISKNIFPRKITEQSSSSSKLFTNNNSSFNFILIKFKIIILIKILSIRLSSLF